MKHLSLSASPSILQGSILLVAFGLPPIVRADDGLMSSSFGIHGVYQGELNKDLDLGTLTVGITHRERKPGRASITLEIDAHLKDPREENRSYRFRIAMALTRADNYLTVKDYDITRDGEPFTVHPEDEDEETLLRTFLPFLYVVVRDLSGDALTPQASPRYVIRPRPGVTAFHELGWTHEDKAWSAVVADVNEARGNQPIERMRMDLTARAGGPPILERMRALIFDSPSRYLHVELVRSH